MKKPYLLINLALLTIIALCPQVLNAQNSEIQNITTGYAIYGGNTNNDIAEAVAVDETGARYITGYFEDVIDFDPGPGINELTSQGGIDIFVAKYSQQGELIWAESFGGISNAYGKGIAVDDNYVYVSGYFMQGGNVSIGGSTLTSSGGSDILVFKLNRDDGSAVWAKSYGTPGTESNTQDQAYEIACDANQNIYITGVIGSTINGSNGTVIDFDGIEITIAGKLDAFIAKLNSSGTAQWVKAIGGESNAFGYALAVVDNFVYTGGSFSGNNINFNRDSGPDYLLTSAGFDGFMAKHNTDGVLQWAVKAGGNLDDDQVMAVTADALGNVYATGSFRGNNIDFGNDVLLTSSNIDAFMWKVSSDGITEWAKSLSSAGTNYAYGIEVNQTGEVYAAGTFEGANANFGNGFSLTSKGATDVFLVKTDSQGNTIWAERFGASMFDYVRKMTLFDDKEVITAGGYLFSSNFDSDELSPDVASVGLTDFFLHSFTPTPLGAGSENDPFLIGNLDELHWIFLNPQHWNKHFKQVADINASATSFYEDGKGWAPIGNNTTQFTGVYDGQGYSISNLFINRIEVGVDENTGLFGYINFPAVIKNLALTDASIRGDYVTGSVAGKNYHATVSGCYSSGFVGGRRVVGGLVGENNFEAKIENSYSTSSVFASDTWAGGLSALNFNSAVINNSYSIGEVISSNDGAGGLLAWNSGSSVNNSFWDTETSGLDSSEGGEGKTTAEMTDSITFLNAGWDIKDGAGDDIWNIGNGRNNGYPYLNWQFPDDKGMQFLAFEPLQAKTYGDAAFDLNATVSSGLAITYESSNPDVVTISGSTVTIVGSGSAEITASQPGNENYHPAVSVAQLLVVDKAVLQVQANDKTVTYGDDVPLLDYTFNGFVYNDDETVIDGEPTLNSAYLPGTGTLESPAEITIAVNTLSAHNYDFSMVNGEILINKAPLAIAVNNDSKIYGSADPDFSVNYDSFVLDEDETNLAGSLAISRDPGENVGFYTLTASGLTSDNYDIVFVDGAMEVTPASLTLTAQSNTKVYGFEHGFGGTEFDVSGLVEGDVVTSATFSSDGAAVNAPVGDYPIVVSDAVGTGLSNYTIQYEEGLLAVVVRTLFISGSFTVEDKLYDGTTDATIVQNDLVLDTTVAGDDIQLDNLVVAFETPGPGSDIVVNIVTAELTGSDKDNYVLSMLDSPSATASIIDDTSVSEFQAPVINIYPNPAREFITIESGQYFNMVQVLDVTGKLVKEIKDYQLFEMKLNISDLPNGLYIVAIFTDKGTEIVKLQKMK